MTRDVRQSEAKMLESIANVPNAAQALKPADEIFIVDDNEDYRDLLSAILSLEGYQVTSFPDGASFLQEASSRVPVCVFLDIVMPGLSGLEVLKKLTAKNYAAPIFLISARHDSPAVVEGMKNGARDFIEKPFDPYTAVLRVRDAVELWEGRAADLIVPALPSFEFDVGVRLSPMERDVLAQIMAGSANAEVAEALGISKATVANYRCNLTKKIGAKNSADLVRILLSKSQRRPPGMTTQ
jgi:two-component system response regulator FixJ